MIEATDSSVSASFLGNCAYSHNLNSRFTKCIWTSAKEAHYIDCTFVNCDFSGTDLEGIRLTGTSYDADTKWPAGFSPEKHGAHLAEGEIEKLEARLAELKARQLKPPIHPFGVEMSNG